MRALIFLLAGLLLVGGAPRPAEAQAASGPQEAVLDDVVVLARRSGALMWTVSRDALEARGFEVEGPE